MITYQSLRTKDDDLFLAHAKRALGGDFNYVMECARDAFQKCSRPSEAKRAANLVILQALKDIDEHHWRKEKQPEDKAPRVQVKPGALPPRKQSEKKWTGKSILEMADDKKKGT